MLTCVPTGTRYLRLIRGGGLSIMKNEKDLPWARALQKKLLNAIDYSADVAGKVLRLALADSAETREKLGLCISSIQQ